MRRKTAKFFEIIPTKFQTYVDLPFEDFQIRFFANNKNFRNVQIEIEYEIEEKQE